MYSQSYGFPSNHVWMWELDHQEGWASKNWSFWTVVLEKTLENSRRANQSILKEINPEDSLEGLMLKLKLQYLGHLMWRGNLLEKTLMPGKTEGRRRRRQQRMRWFSSIIYSMNMSLSKLQEMVKDREAWHAAVHGVTKSQTQLSDWRTTIWLCKFVKTCQNEVPKLMHFIVYTQSQWSFCAPGLRMVKQIMG